MINVNSAESEDMVKKWTIIEFSQLREERGIGHILVTVLVLLLFFL